MEKTIRSSRLVRVVAAGALAASLGLGAVSSAYATTKVNITSISVDSFPCPATGTSSTTIAGTVTADSNVPAGTSLTVAVFYHTPANGVDGNGDPKFVTTGSTVLVTFNDTTTGTYSINFNQVAGANSYRIQITAGSTTFFKLHLDSSSNVDPQKNTKSQSVSCGGTPIIVPPGGTSDTPELGSGELLATGLLPIGAILLYRRRRNRRAS